MNFLAKKFAYIKKKLYFCIAFSALGFRVTGFLDVYRSQNSHNKQYIMETYIIKRDGKKELFTIAFSW